MKLDMQEKTSETIPHPELQSYMFVRQDLKQTHSNNSNCNSNEEYRFFNYIVSILLKTSGFTKKKYRFGLYRVLMGFFRFYFRIFNRLEIHGKEKVGRSAIFILNHPGSLDPLLFEAIMGTPVSCFIGWDNEWFISNVLENMLGFLNREGSSDEQIEKIIRTILEKNRFFAIWPEGTLSRKGLVMQGFSGIVKVYATINAIRDIIPFQPVLIQGSQCYNYQFFPRTNKIIIKFLDPIFIPRDWLYEPEKGGRTPREIMDYLMNLLAREHGQKCVISNHRLNRKKKKALR